LLRQAALHVREFFEKAGEFASLGWKRLKLRAVDGAFNAILLLAALVAGLTIIVSAALLMVAGIHHALAQWAGAEWVGELGGGLLALALPILALLVAQRSARRAMLERALHPPAKAEARPPAADPVSPPDSPSDPGVSP
jgi:hypothetical protein